MKESIFIWVPKCAGTSVFNVFNQPGMKKLKNPNTFSVFNNQGSVTFGHVCIQTLLEKNYVRRDYFNRSFKFTFVRNPWDRILSLWKYHFVDNYATFKEFVYRLNKDFPPIGAYNVKTLSQANPMCDWLLDNNGKLIVDFVGRFETLQKDFNFVCDKVGITPQELPHNNKTKHKHYTDYYNDETIELVAQKYAKDIEYFEYKFGE